ncbi:hypothetical protein R3P38DRAFT_2772075 [Favolaschia claudopus]|uniref:Uncharacterized protein n=1 Tax=Favolaschia claudopus TaxID=2862362 RepID=A0AAW0CB72_9AGAR
MAVMASYLFGNPNGATAATPQENVPLMPPAPKWVQIWLQVMSVGEWPVCHCCHRPEFEGVGVQICLVCHCCHPTKWKRYAGGWNWYFSKARPKLSCVAAVAELHGEVARVAKTVFLVKINHYMPSLPPSATSATLTWPPAMATVATQSFRLAVVAETAYIKRINLQLFNALTGSILFKERKTREFRKEDKKIVWGLGK